ncbi:MAG: flavocytochrome c [Coriobacteriia bacterium]|nr:flavocytochrome c [Coriobacteriia bacterium]
MAQNSVSNRSVGRRDFLRTVGVCSAAAAAAGMMATSAQATEAPAVSWDEETDVFVVGTGFAGMAAAIEAKQAGSDVIIIDKMGMWGGNSSLNGGDMAAVGTPLQKDAGVEDSFELMENDMLVAGKYYNHIDKVKKLVEHSAEAVQWLTDIGVEFTKLNFHGGHSVPRTNTTSNATGRDITEAQETFMEGLGVIPRLNTKLVSLVENEDGRIIGAEVLEDYKLGDDASGTPKRIKARKAVVIASGGFAQDVQMRTVHEPRLTDAFGSTNHEGATGEALREVLKHKAMDVHLDWIQLGPWTSPDEVGFGFCPQFCERLVGYAPMIDPATGKRFVKETGDRKVRADKMIELNHVTIIFGDEPTVKRQVVERILNGGLENGVFKKFDTLEEIAEEYDIPKDEFLAEVEKWNGYVEAGEDPDFGTMIMEGAEPTQTPPFYVARLWPKVHHTMGGVHTNIDCQVIDQDFNVIPGLYAAGEVTGGTHGAVRLGSCAITDCVVFGRIAGQKAAAEEPVA